MPGQPDERWRSISRVQAALAIPMSGPAWAIALALSALLLAAPAEAADFVVESTADSVDALPGDGDCADASGACTLRAAVMETNALAGPDVVRVPAGTYVLAIPGTEEDAAATGDLDVTDDLTLLGAGADTTIIDADGIDRVLFVIGASLSVDSLTITGGLASNDIGGGILCILCDGLSVTNSRISGNVGSGGGAVQLIGPGPSSITSTTISGNGSFGIFMWGGGY